MLGVLKDTGRIVEVLGYPNEEEVCYLVDVDDVYCVLKTDIVLINESERRGVK